jgi:hypothetical protein
MCKPDQPCRDATASRPAPLTAQQAAQLRTRLEVTDAMDKSPDLTSTELLQLLQHMIDNGDINEAPLHYKLFASLKIQQGVLVAPQNSFNSGLMRAMAQVADKIAARHLDDVIANRREA